MSVPDDMRVHIAEYAYATARGGARQARQAVIAARVALLLCVAGALLNEAVVIAGETRIAVAVNSTAALLLAVLGTWMAARTLPAARLTRAAADAVERAAQDALSSAKAQAWVAER